MSDWPDDTPKVTPATVFPPRNATMPVDPGKHCTGTAISEEEPVVPEADGKLVIRSIAGQLHEYLYKDMPRGWRPRDGYLSISTPYGWTHWPWGSILYFETHLNGDKYVHAKQAHTRWRAARRREDETCNGEG